MKQWPKVGNKVTFKGAEHFWFKNVTNYAINFETYDRPRKD